MPAKKAVSEVQVERVQFKRLLTENPNYFGNISDSPFKPVKKIIADTRYEELTCVGFNPDANVLEATIAVKLPTGYGGDLCQAGTTEYVRFFVNYGTGWEDAGLAGVRVHDIPTDKDCAEKPDKPLTYVASLKYKPRPECCKHPVLPRVHAILSLAMGAATGASQRRLAAAVGQRARLQHSDQASPVEHPLSARADQRRHPHQAQGTAAVRAGAVSSHSPARSAALHRRRIGQAVRDQGGGRKDCRVPSFRRRRPSCCALGGRLRSGRGRRKVCGVAGTGAGLGRRRCGLG